MIYVIVTACIRNKHGVKDAVHRRDRYIECISTLIRYAATRPSIKVVIVENNGLRKT